MFFSFFTTHENLRILICALSISHFNKQCDCNCDDTCGVWEWTTYRKWKQSKEGLPDERIETVTTLPVERPELAFPGSKMHRQPVTRKTEIRQNQPKKYINSASHYCYFI